MAVDQSPGGEGGANLTAPHWFELPLSPEEKLINVVFGIRRHDEFHDTPSFIPIVDGIEARVVIDQILLEFTEREALIIRQRFGFTLDKQSRTIEQVAAVVGVSGERIKQIEAKGLRKLRVPRRSRLLKIYLAPIDVRAERAAIARYELFNKIAAAAPHLTITQAKRFAIRCTRQYLARALRAAETADFKALNLAIANSCKVFTELTDCLLCDQPALPGIDWCLEHIQQLHRPKQIVVACATCGSKFLRHEGRVIPRNHSYCSSKCFGASGIAGFAASLGKATMVLVICVGCGKEFERNANLLKNGSSIFCGRECYGNHQRLRKMTPSMENGTEGWNYDSRP